MEGWLAKKTDGRFWSTHRYFVRLEGVALNFCRSETDKPAFTLQLTVAQLTDDASTPFCFQLIGPYFQKGCTLQAADEDAKRGWMDAIRAAIEKDLAQNNNNYEVDLDSSQSEGHARQPQAKGNFLQRALASGKKVINEIEDVDVIDWTDPAFANQQPIWHHPCFLAIFLESCLIDPDKLRRYRPSEQNEPSLRHLNSGLGFFGVAIDKLIQGSKADKDASLVVTQSNVVMKLLYQAMELLGLLNAASDPDSFIKFLSHIVALVTKMDAGDILMLPGGWARPEGDSHCVLYVLRRHKEGSNFDFSIINTGPGIEYHGARATADPPEIRIEHNLVLTLKDVPKKALKDSSFWFVLYTIFKEPDVKNGPELVYGTLLPYLNTRPITSNIQEEGDVLPWRPLPNYACPFSTTCVLESIRFCYFLLGLSAHEVDFVEVLIKLSLTQIAGESLSKAKELSGPETLCIRLASKQLARQAGEVSRIEKEGNPALSMTRWLKKIQICIHATENHVRSLGAKEDAATAPPAIQIPSSGIVQDGCGAYHLFGRLCRDTSVEKLAGSAKIPPISLPVELTLCKDSVQSLNDVTDTLRQCVNLCTVLSNQAGHMKNTYCTRIALIQHLFTQVIPIPLPLDHPEINSCFWRSKAMRYETQKDLLCLLHQITRHYTVAAFSLLVTRSLDSTRILTMACIAAIGDVVMRTLACDIPSQLSLFYSGKTAGPVKPFGFGIGNFAVESEYLTFGNPSMVTCRTQVLDYFTAQLKTVDSAHVLMPFETAMVMGEGEKALINQICLRLGFSTTTGNGEDALPLYFSGEYSDIHDLFPELMYFRDIVFIFRAFMVPTSDALPSIKAWKPTDAKLQWKYDTDKKNFVVMGFQTQLKCHVHVDAQAKESDGGVFSRLYRMITSAKARAPLSGADPNNLLTQGTQRIETEDDVLHLQNLPSFGGMLGPRDCELLLSYLTVPYLRIPLVLQFFADKSRMSALSSEDLQSVVDACLFEPSLWQTSSEKSLPTVVPAPTRDHLATPCGLLFNELEQCPGLITKTLEEMLTLALERDTGRYSSPACEVILYITRLAVRVEGFILFLIRHSKWLAEQEAMPTSASGGTGYCTYIRGLGCNARTLQILKDSHQSLRKILNEQVAKVLERYLIRAARDHATHMSCVLHLHIAFIYRHLTIEELEPSSIASILLAQCYINNHHSCDIEMQVGAAGSTRGVMDKSQKELGIPPTEIFELWQVHRFKLLQWLDLHPIEATAIMEIIVKAITYTGQSDAKYMCGSHITKLIQDKQLTSRTWENMKGEDCNGRYVPKAEMAALETYYDKLNSDQNATYDDWLRHTMTHKVGTEINLQLGEFTLKKNSLQILGSWANMSHNFVALFGRVTPKNSIQCAEMANTTHRRWLRLVGRNYDIQYWDPDPQVPPVVYKNSLSSILNTISSTAWVEKILGFYRDKYLSGIDLYMQDHPPEGYAVLQGLIMEPAGANQSRKPLQLIEVVVIRDPPAVHVYSVVEHGRRYYRTLTFTSNLAWTLHTPQPATLILRKDANQHVPELVSGDPKTIIRSAHSLVITRNLSASVGVQTQIPKHFLYGQLPTALFEEYEFWQNEDDSLAGYQHKKRRENTKIPSMIRLKLMKTGNTDYSGFCNSEASAHIQRVPLKYHEDNRHKLELKGLDDIMPSEGRNETGLDDVMPSEGSLDKGKPVLTLINLLDCKKGTALQELAMLLLRLDNLSHCLVWSDHPYANTTDICNVSLVELPRLGLSFQPKNVRDHETGQNVSRLYSNEHEGRFISCKQDPMVNALLKGVPNCILLEDEQGKMFALVSALTLPRRLAVKSSFQTLTSVLPTEVVLDRSNQGWIDHLGDQRHYIYPIHPCKAFLFTPTLASALYLLLLRFLSRQYELAFKMIDTCVSDTRMTEDEAQIWDQLAYLNNDGHPNAHAVRLKLSVSTLGFDSIMKCPWNMGTEMLCYVAKRRNVSATCRLTPQEEFALLQQVSRSQSYLLANRYELLSKWFSEKSDESTEGASESLLDFGKSIEVAVAYPSLNHAPVPSFDRSVDKTFITTKLDFFTNHFSMLSYSRPKPTELTGIEAARLFMRLLKKGINLKGGKEKLGFMFLYELLTGSLIMQVLPNDNPFNWGSILTRLLPKKEKEEKGHLISILRMLIANPHVCARMPTFEDNRKLKTSVYLPGQDPFARLLKNISSVWPSIEGQVTWPETLWKVFVRPFNVAIPDIEKFFTHRSWRVPRVLEYGCNSRTFMAFTSNNLTITEADAASFTDTPLASLQLHEFVQEKTRQEQGLSPVPSGLPFDVSGHDCAKSQVAISILQRMKTDMEWYADSMNKKKTASLVGFSIEEFQKWATDSAKKKESIQKVGVMMDRLLKIRSQDIRMQHQASGFVLQLANSVDPAAMIGSESLKLQRKMAFELLQYGGYESTITLELLVQLLMEQGGDLHLQQLNPFISKDRLGLVKCVMASLMMSVSRTSQANRCLTMGWEIYHLIQSKVGSSESLAPDLAQSLLTKSQALALALIEKRHYIQKMKPNAAGAITYKYDPRYAVFEFIYSIILRESQVELIDRFLVAVKKNKSLAHQMIMGAGKTTVVGPLLALMLGNQNRLVAQVVPHALLEFSRAIMRERFSAVIHKPVYTFSMDRFTLVAPEMYKKLQKARDVQAVVCCSPTALKSLVLRLIETMHTIDHAKNAKGRGSVRKNLLLRIGATLSKGADMAVDDLVKPLTKEVEICVSMIQLLRNGALILDEVDLLLHPLRSELNWPLGVKEPLDFTKAATAAPASSATSGKPVKSAVHGDNANIEAEVESIMGGLRWKVPQHLLDGLLYATGNEGPSVSKFGDSREAMVILKTIQNAVREGAKQRMVQTTPHLVLLSPWFYTKQIQPLLCRWMLIYLRQNGVRKITDEDVISYLQASNSELEPLQHLQEGMGDRDMKLLNLSREWIRNLIPHVFSKINRVTYGLLTTADLEKVLILNPTTPLSRRYLAVPFVGKDVPSRASEFSHPDVVIGLSMLAYRYEGLRVTDFKSAISALIAKMQNEAGPAHKKKSCLTYNKWVQAAGGQVRGTQAKSDLKSGWDSLLMFEEEEESEFDDIWPLDNVDIRDTEQMEVLYRLLSALPHLIEFYLHEIVFPMTLSHTGIQLSASGQELGGDILFPLRLGFSGTPSDLLPVELGKCQYEKGDDAKMVHALTNPATVSDQVLPSDWSVRTILDVIASSTPPYHALIDTGALITGMTNIEVARYLLESGLPTMDGVVFLDGDDKQQVLMRDGMKVAPLSQCGIPKEKRFTFYDQVHTTGMDISHTFNATAVLTLGKDMVFRDYTQGAFRMRGINNGQRITLFIIPEVLKLIRTQLAAANKRKGAHRETLSRTPSMGNTEQMLKDVCAWLLINSMRLEAVQFNLLCRQNLKNLWRKQAFNTLVTQREAFYSKQQNERAEHCVDTFRERIDYTVENTVPQAVGYSEKLLGLAEKYKDLLPDANDQKTVKELCKAVCTAETEQNKPAADSDAPDITQVQLEMEVVQEQEEEQEEEQEQEQEQEKEVEEEKEVEVQYEEPAKLKFSRDDEASRPWKLATLSEKPGNQGFYPCAEFAVHKSMMSKVEPLSLPDDSWISSNHYRVGWSLKTYRRLKNMIIIMEWIPDFGQVKPGGGSGLTLSAPDEGLLKKSFNMIDSAKEGMISVIAFKELLQGLDVDETDPIVQDMLQSIASKEGTAQASFEDAKRLVLHERQTRIQKGRYFVALSLAEAETLRGVLHMAGSNPIFPQSRTLVALRLIKPLGGFSLLDSSEGFTTLAPRPSQAQYNVAEQTYRFLDSETHYTQPQMRSLLRSIQDNPCPSRETFFVDVRKCRRRPQVDVQRTPLRSAMMTATEFHLLPRRVLILRVRSLLAAKRMWAHDAFRIFDANRNGLLSVNEILRGLDWLGIQKSIAAGLLFEMIPSGDPAAMVFTLDDFKHLFEIEDEEFAHGMEINLDMEADDELSKLDPGFALEDDFDCDFAITSGYGSTAQGSPSLSANFLKKFNAKPRQHTTMCQIWSTEGTMSRTDASVWAPEDRSLSLAGMKASNKERVILGHYVMQGTSPPSKGGAIIEFGSADLFARIRTQETRDLHAVVARICPHPIRFKQVWSKQHGKKSLFVWAAIPPSIAHVALGMVATNTEAPPPLDSMRCVPKAWVRATKVTPQLIWDDRGTGGKEGSMWSVPATSLLFAHLGHNAPKETLYELRDTLYLEDGASMGIH